MSLKSFRVDSASAPIALSWEELTLLIVHYGKSVDCGAVYPLPAADELATHAERTTARINELNALRKAMIFNTEEVS